MVPEGFHKSDFFFESHENDPGRKMTQVLKTENDPGFNFKKCERKMTQFLKEKMTHVEK